jgi:hypothetical protein
MTRQTSTTASTGASTSTSAGTSTGAGTSAGAGTHAGTSTGTGTSTSTSTGTGTRRKRSNRASYVVTPDKHRTLLMKFAAFLQGLEAHRHDPDFPSFFADGSVEAALRHFADRVKALDAARATDRMEKGTFDRIRNWGWTIVELGEAALRSDYGPAAPILADFGVKPRGPRGRRRHNPRLPHPQGAEAGDTSTATKPPSSTQ